MTRCNNFALFSVQKFKNKELFTQSTKLKTQQIFQKQAPTNKEKESSSFLTEFYYGDIFWHISRCCCCWMLQVHFVEAVMKMKKSYLFSKGKKWSSICDILQFIVKLIFHSSVSLELNILRVRRTNVNFAWILIKMKDFFCSVLQIL